MWLLCSAVKSPLRSSSAWWPMRPWSGPGKRTPSTSHTCSWTQPVHEWTVACYQPYPCSWTLSKAHMERHATPWWNPAGYTPITGATNWHTASSQAAVSVIPVSDARCQLRCDLPVPQAPGYHESATLWLVSSPGRNTGPCPLHSR